MKTLQYSHTEYVVTHDRLITLGVQRVQQRKDEFVDEERALSCVRALQGLAVKHKPEISNIEMQSRQVWVADWDYSFFGPKSALHEEGVPA